MQINQRIDAYLDGVSLRHTVPDVVIRDVQEQAGETPFALDSPWGAKRTLAVRRESLRLTLSLSLWEFRSLERRMAILDQVNAWAAPGGLLTLSTRPGQQLRVARTESAVTASVREYGERLRVTWDAAFAPFWEEETPRSLQLSGTSGSGSLRTGGTVRGGNCARACCEVTPTDGTLQTLTLSAGDTAMRFSGLSVASGATLRLDYDELGLLRIKKGSQSKLSCRSAVSDDDLLVPPGGAVCAFTANVECAVRFYARGRFW